MEKRKLFPEKDTYSRRYQNYAAGTVLDMVLMGRRPFIKWNIREQDIQIALEILDRIGAVELAHREFCSLSGGQRQKILIARAMAQEPEMFLFDEPISFWMYRTSLVLWKWLAIWCGKRTSWQSWLSMI